ncbi:hypothetical protein BKA66DRAFT_263653 [Pyrenochaeta sp. MPI-SDFR-AT-0127]|nr:hypothetical protein BKA66DRAFT_263653 [Pyrenochaeta sp. MPI-SDFR-AT-0127]
MVFRLLFSLGFTIKASHWHNFSVCTQPTNIILLSFFSQIHNATHVWYSRSNQIRMTSYASWLIILCSSRGYVDYPCILTCCLLDATSPHKDNQKR